jgi:hypothetical protein
MESKTRVRCWTMLDVDTARQGGDRGGDAEESPILRFRFRIRNEGVHIISKREKGLPSLDRPCRWLFGRCRSIRYRGSSLSILVLLLHFSHAAHPYIAIIDRGGHTRYLPQIATGDNLTNYEEGESQNRQTSIEIPTSRVRHIEGNNAASMKMISSDR